MRVLLALSILSAFVNLFLTEGQTSQTARAALGLWVAYEAVFCMKEIFSL